MIKFKNTYHLIVKFIILGFVLSFSSCMLFKKKCPLPSCEISKMHRHLLIFKDLESPRDKRKKERKKARDEKKFARDSVRLSNEKNKPDTLEIESEGHKATYYEVDGEVLDEEGNEFVDEKEQKKRDKAKARADKKKARKEARKARLAKKGKLSEEELIGADSTAEDENEYSGMTEDEYKQKLLEESNLDGEYGDKTELDEKQLAKEVKKEDRAAKKVERKKERVARKKKRGETDFTKLYRSRVTKWWRRNQYPKTGKYFKRKGRRTKVG